MKTARLEAFSDGVIAILITIMVLELPKPEEATWTALREDLPVLLAYLLSFIFLGIYWNNHHHLFQIVSGTRGGVLWANLHLLFWLSLIPFVTDWMSEQNFQIVPVIAYGLILLLAAAAYLILSSSLLRAEGPQSRFAAALGSNLKGKISMVLYVLGIVGSLFTPLLGLAFYVVVAVIWLVPDSRIERQVVSSAPES